MNGAKIHTPRAYELYSSVSRILLYYYLLSSTHVASSGENVSTRSKFGCVFYVETVFFFCFLSPHTIIYDGSEKKQINLQINFISFTIRLVNARPVGRFLLFSHSLILLLDYAIVFQIMPN